MKNKLFFILIIGTVSFSCKKEQTPEPVPGKVIVNDIPGEYSGYFNSTLQINHRSTTLRDSGLSTSISIYDSPEDNYDSRSSAANAISINNYSTTYDNYSYYLSLGPGETQNPFLHEFKTLSYSVNSGALGTFTFLDNNQLCSFSNSNAIPLNLSNSTPYVLTLNNLINCDFVEITAGDFEVYRTILPSNPSAKIYASEFIDATVGRQINLEIDLVSSKDTVINSRKFKMQKRVKHEYAVTFTN